MKERIWHSGPPPHIGWWNASRSSCRNTNAWRWWNGEFWSAAAWSRDEAHQAANRAKEKPMFGDIEWSDYWPENARVPRIDPRKPVTVTTRKVKVREASGHVLNWLVAEIGFRREPSCKGWVMDAHRKGAAALPYSSDWLLGGPIIKAEKLSLHPLLRNGDWYGEWRSVCLSWEGRTHTDVTADDPLIAAMRCHVISILGNEVEVPDGLA